MSVFPIPDSALARHIAVLGETGSGKTHDTKSIVEHLVGEGYRVCVLDTIKSDWWGMISSASGKKPGLDFKIIGGPRGHVPLHRDAGAAIGELVAKGKLPLSIIDMADFDMGDPQHFFVDFAKALWKHAKGVVYLVIEEAHEIAPKERVGSGSENMAVYWAKKLATGSRTKGIRLVIASQRTQAVHNALLGSCGTMIAHSLSLPADQKPVRDWLDANVLDKDLKTNIKDEMAGLPVGTAWVCCARERFFEKLHFPKISTFDNTATPDKDADDFNVTTTAVDPGELRSIIGDAVKEAEANDPKVLKKQVAELEREKASLELRLEHAQAAPDVSHETIRDEEAITRASDDGFNRGFDAGFLSGHQDGWKGGAQALLAVVSNVSFPAYEPPASPSPPKNITAPITVPAQGSAARPSKPMGQVGSKPAGDAKSTGLSPALQRVIDAVAWWEKIGHSPIQRDRVAVFAGYSPKASTIGVYIGDLVKAGLLSTSPGHVQLTAMGKSSANWPSAVSRKELHDHARGLLGPQEARVFDAIYAAYPREISRDKVADALSLSRTASTVGVYIGAVAGYGIVEKASPGHVKAAAWLFPG